MTVQRSSVCFEARSRRHQGEGNLCLKCMSEVREQGQVSVGPRAFECCVMGSLFLAFFSR